MVWQIKFSDAAKKDMAALDKPVAKRINKFLRERVAKLDDVRAIGEALTGDVLGDFWKYRVGDWRVIARIEDELVRVLVVRIGSRRDIYREASRKGGIRLH